MKIAIIGLWHLGLTYSAALTALENEILAIDLDKSLIADLENYILPIEEPGLLDQFKYAKSKKLLEFTSDLSKINEVDLVWYCRDTPINEHDEADIEAIFLDLTNIINLISPSIHLIISSQLPVGSISYLLAESKSAANDKAIKICYNPENLQLGKSLSSFLNAESMIFGINNEHSEILIREIFAHWEGHLRFTSIVDSELLKHATNSFLAMSVTFANEIGYIAQDVGANGFEIASLLKLDPRIGKKSYLNPGPNFGGGTLARDLEFLRKITEARNIETELLNSIAKSNNAHLNNICNELLGFLKQNMKVGFAGITYKEGTSTLRGSQYLSIRKQLGNDVCLPFCDPLSESFSEIDNDRFPNYEKLIESCDVIVLLRPNYEFTRCLEKLNLTKSLTILNWQGLLFEPIENMNINIVNFGVGRNV